MASLEEQAAAGRGNKSELETPSPGCPSIQHPASSIQHPKARKPGFYCPNLHFTPKFD
jgi:hypothetical protein